MSRLVTLLSLVVLAATGCAEAVDGGDPELGTGEGVDFDAENPDAPMDDGKSDIPRYTIPTNLPRLAAPEILISLDGLTVHLFDRQTGFSKVYPAGVGVKNSRGVSITPTGHFRTSPNVADGWWYAARRTNPEYFGGFPFLRFDARNRDGAYTYGMHGPIEARLTRGYVSHGCIRMASRDIIDLFWMVKSFPETPVTVQKEVERDANGRRVDINMTPALWPADAAIPFGSSVGPRPW